MIGKRFGKLTVVKLKDITEYPDMKRPVLEWYCNCDCGNKNILARGTELRAGRRKMCPACSKKERQQRTHEYFFKDISGRKFGKLTAIRPYYDNWKDNDNKSTLWLCKCDCGSAVIVTENNLQRKHVYSCGCLISKGEERVRFVLDLYGVSYERQYKFDDLRNRDTNRRLKFDFAVFDNEKIKFLLEYDGNQHVYGTRYSKNESVNKRKFERLKQSDKAKNEYCKDKCIKLIRISHKDYNNIYEIVFDILLKEDLIKWQDLKKQSENRCG